MRWRWVCTLHAMPFLCPDRLIVCGLYRDIPVFRVDAVDAAHFLRELTRFWRAPFLHVVTGILFVRVLPVLQVIGVQQRFTD